MHYYVLCVAWKFWLHISVWLNSGSGGSSRACAEADEQHEDQQHRQGVHVPFHHGHRCRQALVTNRSFNPKNACVTACTKPLACPTGSFSSRFACLHVRNLQGDQQPVSK